MMLALGDVNHQAFMAIYKEYYPQREESIDGGAPVAHRGEKGED